RGDGRGEGDAPTLANVCTINHRRLTVPLPFAAGWEVVDRWDFNPGLGAVAGGVAGPAEDAEVVEVVGTAVPVLEDVVGFGAVGLLRCLVVELAAACVSVESWAVRESVVLCLLEAASPVA